MEFSLIDRIRRRAATRGDVVLGIGDDAALLRPPAGEELAISADTLNEGVHFPSGTPAADIGWKALAVNLSDLAAMGAAPAWVTLSLSLPAADSGWLDAFLDGFLALAAQHDVVLVGGDTTRGPLSIAVTALGFVPAGAAMRRAGARPGDEVWVTGDPGEAAAGLAQWRRGETIDPFLRARLDRPTPRVAAGIALRSAASACIDVSDGLAADLGHLLEASGVGATLELARLPRPAALAALPQPARWNFQLGGGDDYELCFTAPAAARERVGQALARCDTAAHVIGRIDPAPGLRLLDPHGEPWRLAAPGWDHFAAAPQ
jgi:thiamine-monophosphate kinase